MKLLCNPELVEGKYTTLSYCWGKAPFIQTTTKTLEARKSCIKWDELPITFRDAIIITRELGIRYIWIDSLCILQDDNHDWEVESSKMSSIYENSYLTIAATHAADSNGGCFHRTEGVGKTSLLNIPSSPNVRIRVLSRDDHNEFFHTYCRTRSPKPLTRRGWAFQERLLSPRTIHYMATELVWECNAHLDCQCGGIHVSGQFNWSRTLLESKASKDRQLHDWLLVVELYTAQELTYLKDRLSALSGLVQQAKRNGWGQYVAGLWRHGLEITTAWEVQNRPMSGEKYLEYLGPSWSRVNIPGAVRYPGYINDHRFRPLAQSLVELHDIHISTGMHSSGRVFGASMLVSGRSVEAILSPLAPGTGESATRQAPYSLSTIPRGYKFFKIFLDAPLDNDQKGPSGEMKVKLVPWLYYLAARVEQSEMKLMILAQARTLLNVLESR